MLTPDEATHVDVLRQAFSRCIRELSGEIALGRCPHRTRVEIDSVEGHGESRIANLIIPGWTSSEIVALRFSDLPWQIQKSANKGQQRFYAHVNTTAEAQEELFFESWEVA